MSTPAAPRAPAAPSALDALAARGVWLNRGCAPQGTCGCCAARVDGKARLTCTLPATALAGKEVQAGPEDPLLLPIFGALALELGEAARCGYCTVAIASSLAAKLPDLQAAGPSASAPVVQRALAPHLCRCTGYAPFYAAGEHLAAALTALSEGDAAPIEALAAAGEPLQARLAARLPLAAWQRPGLLEAQIEEVEGQLHARVVTPEGGVHTAPLEPHRDAPEAWVARLRAFSGGEAAEPPRVSEPSAFEAAWEAARAAGTPTTAFSVHLPAGDSLSLEPDTALAVPGSEGIVVYSNTEDPYAALRAARAAAPSVEDVVAQPAGGAFGARVTGAVEAAAAALAAATDAPVRVSLSLAQSLRVRARRPGVSVEVRGIAGEGESLAALWARASVHAGASISEGDTVLAALVGALSEGAALADIEARLFTGPGQPTTAAADGAAGLAACLVHGIARGHLWPSAPARLSRAPAGAGAGPAVVRAGVEREGAGARVAFSRPLRRDGEEAAALAALAAALGVPPDALVAEEAPGAWVGPASPAWASLVPAVEALAAAVAAGGGLRALAEGERVTVDALSLPGEGEIVAEAHTAAGPAGVKLVGLDVTGGRASEARLSRAAMLGAAWMGVEAALTTAGLTTAGLTATTAQPEGALRLYGLTRLPPGFVLRAALAPAGASAPWGGLALPVAAGAVARALAAAHPRTEWRFPLTELGALKR